MEWAKVELMGHRVRVGRVSEVDRFGAKMLCIEPVEDDGATGATEFYGAAAIFCVTATTEAAVMAAVELARARAARWKLLETQRDDAVEAVELEKDTPF